MVCLNLELIRSIKEIKWFPVFAAFHESLVRTAKAFIVQGESSCHFILFNYLLFNFIYILSWKNIFYWFLFYVFGYTGSYLVFIRCQQLSAKNCICFYSKIQVKITKVILIMQKQFFSQRNVRLEIHNKK